MAIKRKKKKKEFNSYIFTVSKSATPCFRESQNRHKNTSLCVYGSCPHSWGVHDSFKKYFWASTMKQAHSWGWNCETLNVIRALTNIHLKKKNYCKNVKKYYTKTWQGWWKINRVILHFFLKEVEKFLCANLRVITWETAFQKALRTLPSYLQPVLGKGLYAKGLYLKLTYWQPT